MNKKSVISLIVAAFFILTISSCSKAYEDVPLGQQIPLDLAFDTHDSAGVYAIRYLLNVYNGLPNGHNRIGGNYLASASDDAVSSASGTPAVQQIATGAYTASATNADNVWNNYYAGIRTATIFVNNINRVPIIEKLPDGNSAKNAYKAEARWIRAWYYFELLKRYGGVPLLGDEVREITDDIQLPRNTFEEGVNYIVSECDAIKDSLRAEPVDANHYGSVTRGAALALKSRVLLYAASPLFNGGNIDPNNKLTGYVNNDQNRWNLAADAARELINKNVFSLMPGFKDVFITQAMAAGTNTEKIFWRQNGNNTSVETANGPVGYFSAGGAGITSPTQNLVDAFLTNEGKLITDPASGYNPNAPYSNRDPRLEMSIFYNGKLWLNRPVETFDGGQDKPGGALQQTKTGYYMRKFMGNFENSNLYSNTNHDWIFFRYAEVLLNFAEAENEFSGPTAEVYNAIKALRKRAGILPGTDDQYGLKAGMSKTDMRAIIHNERRIELSFEEHRFWDIRRWKIAADVYNTAPLQGMNIQKTSGGVLYFNMIAVLTTVFKSPQMYFYPIPYSEVIKNNAMVQNPGW